MVSLKTMVFSAIASSVVFAASAVRATTVEYYTVGQFTPAGGTVSNGSANPGSVPLAGIDLILGYAYSVPTEQSYIDDGGGGKLVYYYSGQHILNASGVPTVANFGAFSLTSTLGHTFSLSGYGFNLSIFQVLPGAGSDTLIGTLSGTISVTGSGASSTVYVTFGSGSVFLPPGSPVVEYDVPLSNPLSPVANTTLQGFVELGSGAPPAAPLPAEASLGVTMFGLLACGLAGRKLARRARVA